MDKNGGNQQQKESFELEEEQQQDQNDSMNCQPATDFRSIFGMDSGKLAEKFNKLEAEMKKKDVQMMALKQENGKLKLENEASMKKEMEMKMENDKLKEEIEALKAEKSQAYSESSSESSIEIASDFTPEMNTRKRPVKRFINWLRDSLPWIDREEMANSELSTSCELFRQLCWPKLHQNVKPYKISCLRIYSNEIPSFPPPDYIIGIKKINFCNMDDQIVNFAKNIAHFIQNCKLAFLGPSKFAPWKMDKKRIASICALLEFLADKIIEIDVSGPKMNDIKQLFPGILDHVQSNEVLQVQDYTRIFLFLKY